jgi:hypothetical protein
MNREAKLWQEKTAAQTALDDAALILSKAQKAYAACKKKRDAARKAWLSVIEAKSGPQKCPLPSPLPEGEGTGAEGEGTGGKRP